MYCGRFVFFSPLRRLQKGKAKAMEYSWRTCAHMCTVTFQKGSAICRKHDSRFKALRTLGSKSEAVLSDTIRLFIEDKASTTPPTELDSLLGVFEVNGFVALAFFSKSQEIHYIEAGKTDKQKSK